MIQLQAIARPADLTDDIVQQLTAQFQKDKTEVWNKSYIRGALLKMSFGKCCFCECRINEESKYLEVEHFHPKNTYSDEVVLWENLLPICKRCNVHKGNHDTKQEPIIHPVRNNPKEHLKLNNYRLKAKTQLGKDTITAIALNDNSQNLVQIRFDIGNGIIDSLDCLLELTIGYCDKPNTRRKNRIIGQLRTLMSEGTKESSYSATAATIILSASDYIEIKKLFNNCNLWTDEFSQLEQQVQDCAL